MKVLIVSHAYVAVANRTKLTALAGFNDLDLGVVYPKKWQTWHGEKKDQKLNIKNQNSYQEFPLGTFWGSDAGKYFYNPIQLIISLIRFKPDLIHLEEEPYSLVGAETAVIAWLFRIKMTFFTWENMDDLRLGGLRTIFEKIILKISTAAVAGTSGARRRLERRGFEKEIKVIPQFGVDTQVFCPDPSARPRLANGVVLGFVGRPTLDKGIDLLLEALAKLSERYKLLWVTSSAEVPEVFLDQIKALGLWSRVDIETKIPHEKLPEFYRQMDLYVLPSRTTPTWQEQFGRTLLEAMACGVPVIGSSSGAIPEVVGEAGLIFREGDAEDLAQKIMSLGEASYGQELSKLGRQRVNTLFTGVTVAQKLHDFLIRFSPTRNR